ncbi:hypothetical protein GOV08_01355 [Candidatus Woesearchaeota archaeon]|nr:hypothetical protein [Candidatus Woesearchaeota archaeon]
MRGYIISTQRLHGKESPPKKNPFTVLYKDFKRIYKAYPKETLLTITGLVALVILVQIKPLLFFLFFLAIDRIVQWLFKSTDFKLGIEQVSIISILFGYYYNLFLAFAATVVFIVMHEQRNIKFNFTAAGINGIIWLVFPFAAKIFAVFGVPITTVGFILPIARWIIKESANVLIGFQVHNVHINLMNLIYQIFFFRYLGVFFGAILL